MDSDRLFKELLRTFFADFVDLFLPDVSAYLRRETVEFLDKEIFTDVTAGDRREVDLVAKARFRAGRAFFLLHVENQASRRRGFARRMFAYFARLHEKYGLPVYPIALFTYDRPRNPEADAYRVAFPDRAVLDFRFRAIQLNRLDWRDYAGRQNPVAAALMAKMDIAPRDRPRVKLECLRLLVSLRLDRARMQLISGFVDSYLQLSKPERRVFDRGMAAVAPPERKAMIQITNSWQQEGMRKGRREGRKEGRHEGRLEGRQDMVLRLLAKRLGPVSPAVEKKVRLLPAGRLDALQDALFDFKTPADVTSWLAKKPAGRAAAESSGSRKRNTRPASP